MHNSTDKSSLDYSGLYFMFFVICLFCALFVTSVNATPQTKTYSESQIKVALVYKLMHFISWPVATPLTLCVYKPNEEDIVSFSLMPSHMELGNTIDVIMLYESGHSFRQNECHIIYFNSNTGSDIKKILLDVTNERRLTIGQTNQFMKQGGMINLVQKDSSIKFEINISALKQAGLTISSQVLRVAHQVYSEDSDE